MGEVSEQIYVHILNQTLLDNSVAISNTELAQTYQIPLDEVEGIIEGLIKGGYILKIREGFYTVLFSHLDEISVAGKIIQS